MNILRTGKFRIQTLGKVTSFDFIKKDFMTPNNPTFLNFTTLFVIKNETNRLPSYR